mgnify:CR=1 FL=1
MFGNPTPLQYLALAATMGLALFLPHVLSIYHLYVGNILMMYAVLALGLSVLIGWCGQFAFAHIAFFGIGAYGTSLLDISLGLPFVIGMPVAALFAGALGLLIGFPSTRLRSVYLALATFAFAECAQWAFRTWDGVTGGADGLRLPPAEIFGISVTNDATAFPITAAIMLIMILATISLTRSRLGRSFTAIRDSEHVAAACGIPVNRTKVIAFAVSAVYAGVAGGMFSLLQNFFTPDSFGVNQLVIVLTMCVVGGAGSIVGVILGVLLMGLLPEVLRAFPANLLVWQEFLYGFILVLSVMFMPAGIWGLLRPRLKRLTGGRPASAANAEKGVAG